MGGVWSRLGGGSFWGNYNTLDAFFTLLFLGLKRLTKLLEVKIMCLRSLGRSGVVDIFSCFTGRVD